jgi:hypothetical protein
MLKAIGTRYAKDGDSPLLNKLLQNAIHIHHFSAPLQENGAFRLTFSALAKFACHLHGRILFRCSTTFLRSSKLLAL